MINYILNLIIPTSPQYSNQKQSVNIKYAIATIKDNIIENAHEFVKCREYITAFLHMLYCKKTVNNHYLDCYINTVKDIPKNYLYLIINVTAYTTFQRNFNNYMHYYDSLLNVKTNTEILPIKSHKTYFVIKADIQWSKNTVLFSIFTWILRLLCYQFSNLNKEPFESLGITDKFAGSVDRRAINQLSPTEILQFIYLFPKLYIYFPKSCYVDTDFFSQLGIHFFLTCYKNYHNKRPVYYINTAILNEYKKLCDANPVIPSFQRKNDKPVGLPIQ